MIKNSNVYYILKITDENTRRDGYVTNTIKAHVPAIENSLSGGITPQHNMQSPHTQDMQIPK